jgi:hypothetical protein
LRNDRRGYQDLDGAAFHLVGVRVGRILKCETVADLPVQQSTTVALTLNLETAKTLGAPMKFRGNPSMSTNGTFLPCQRRGAMSVMGRRRPTYARCEVFAF